MVICGNAAAVLNKCGENKPKLPISNRATTLVIHTSQLPPGSVMHFLIWLRVLFCSLNLGTVTSQAIYLPQHVHVILPTVPSTLSETKTWGTQSFKLTALSSCLLSVFHGQHKRCFRASSQVRFLPQNEDRSFQVEFY